MVWDWDRHEAEAWGGPRGGGVAEPPTFFSLFDAVSIVARLRSPLRRWDREKRIGASVGPPAVAVVGRLVGLGLLRDGAGLATLPAARLQGNGRVNGEEKDVELVGQIYDIFKWRFRNCFTLPFPWLRNYSEASQPSEIWFIQQLKAPLTSKKAPINFK